MARGGVRVAAIQRSRGYAERKSLTIDKIEKAIKVIKEASPETIIMVDNCYGEFVETIEPSDVGADMTVGSLIKNPGGGLAPIGGYIADKFKEKTLLILGGLLMGIGSVWFGMLTSAASIMIIHVIYGVGVVLIFSPYLKVTRKLGTAEEQGRMFSVSEFVIYLL